MFKRNITILGLLFSIAFIFIVLSLSVSIDIPTLHLDGHYQTASSLFRINDGQLIGKDFLPYLGIAPTFLVYPIYFISGAELSDSVFSAQLMVYFFQWLSVVIICRLILKRMSLAEQISTASIIYLICIAIGYFSFNYIFTFSTTPGNSLRPIRMIIPYLAGFSIYLIFNLKISSFYKNLLLGVVLAISLLWSNDLAIPTFLYFSMFIFSYQLFKKSGSKMSFISSFISSFIFPLFFWFVLLYLITGGHYYELLKFNFVDVANDQWWYYGPYEQSRRVFVLEDLFNIFNVKLTSSLLCLALCLYFSIKDKSLEYCLLFSIGSVLFLGGILSSVGGHIGGYFVGFYFWSIIVSVVYFYKLAILRLKLSSVLIYLKLLIIIFLAILSYINYSHLKETAENDSSKFYVDNLDGYLDISWAPYLEYISRHEGLNVVEEYWGVWGGVKGAAHLLPVDSAIHALGDIRIVATERIKKADILVVTRADLELFWQPWSFSQNFWFYKEILNNFKLDFLAPSVAVWKRVEGNRRDFDDALCTINENKSSFTIDSKHTGLYKINLHYLFEKKSIFSRNLMMLQNNISFAPDANGYVAVDHNQQYVEFPVLMDDLDHNTFSSTVIGGDYNLEFYKCSAQHINFDMNDYFNSDVAYTKPSADLFYVTDRHWEKGIARNWVGFFVKNTTINIQKFKVDSEVVFKDGSSRIINDVVNRGIYLHIVLSGDELLDYEKVGRPDTFTVLENREPFYVTDRNWEKGIARNWVGFFVPNTVINNQNFKVGSEVVFKDRDSRMIKNVINRGSHLYIVVSGELLDFKKTGRPDTFTILKNKDL
ncbi:hypothetical protein [Moritella dasanensis]|uniref:hypothetical protein n=1 Tax=Moritella dasanensis TaxID=428031 RepID=UPI0002D76F31|nr:hypothetical protein [Moritella dasanensis]